MKTILVLEDERAILEAIKLKLESSGFSVLSARSVPEALGYIDNVKSIDAIWLDHYLLGKESGLDFVGNIKQRDGKWKKIPIFVVSNTAGPDKVRSYMELGIDKYYVKAEHRLDEIISSMKTSLEV